MQAPQRCVPSPGPRHTDGAQQLAPACAQLVSGSWQQTAGSDAIPPGQLPSAQSPSAMQDDPSGSATPWQNPSRPQAYPPQQSSADAHGWPSPPQAHAPPWQWRCAQQSGSAVQRWPAVLHVPARQTEPRQSSPEQQSLSVAQAAFSAAHPLQDAAPGAPPVHPYPAQHCALAVQSPPKPWQGSTQVPCGPHSPLQHAKLEVQTSPFDRQACAQAWLTHESAG